MHLTAIAFHVQNIILSFISDMAISAITNNPCPDSSTFTPQYANYEQTFSYNNKL